METFSGRFMSFKWYTETQDVNHDVELGNRVEQAETLLN